MGVVIERWVWLECIGVVSGCCVRRYSTVYRFPHSPSARMRREGYSSHLVCVCVCVCVCVYVC